MFIILCKIRNTCFVISRPPRNCRLSPAANKSATCLRLPPACVRHTSAGLQHTKPSAESGGLLHYRQRRSLCSWLRMAFIRLKTDTSPNLGTDTGLTISRKEGRTIICFKIPTVWIGCFEGASVSDWRHVPD
jgi:hypothetical protein